MGGAEGATGAVTACGTNEATCSGVALADVAFAGGSGRAMTSGAAVAAGASWA